MKVRLDALGKSRTLESNKSRHGNGHDQFGGGPLEKGLKVSPFNIVIAGRAARTSTHDRHSRIQCLEAVLL
jgi:hypothetical protein